jgi:hypothetical protein
VLQPSPLKKISSRDLGKKRSQDLGKERRSREERNEYDKHLHNKIDDLDKWNDTEEALRNLDISLGNVMNFNITTSFVGGTQS